MNIKKLLIIELVLIAVSASFASISAVDEKSISQSKLLVDNKLTVNGINFIIPDGYDEVETDTDESSILDDDESDILDDKNDTEDIDGTIVDASTTSEFKNSNGDKIEIEVGIKANDEKIESINPANSEQKTIANKEGYLIKDTDDGKEQFKFEYLEDGKLVKIVASSEDIISQIIG
jgi:hypothetical protein